MLLNCSRSWLAYCLFLAVLAVFHNCFIRVMVYMGPIPGTLGRKMGIYCGLHGTCNFVHAFYGVLSVNSALCTEAAFLVLKLDLSKREAKCVFCSSLRWVFIIRTTAIWPDSRSYISYWKCIGKDLNWKIRNTLQYRHANSIYKWVK